jgi:hypothetical protein
MRPPEDLWIPLVDEPIGRIVAQIQEEHAEISSLVDTPQRLLAFRTFAYIRVGVLLGELLVENDLQNDGSGTWVDELLAQPEYRARVVAEVRAVAEEVARDPRYAGEEALGPDEEARARVRETLAKQLESRS